MTSFTFGAKTTQAPPTFGSQPAGSITFGTPVAQSGPRFGFSSTPSTGFQLGATTTTQSNLFGAPTTSVTPSLFGTAAIAKPLAFGTPTTTSSGGFGFGTTPSSSANATASTSLAFGTQTTQSGGGLFGTTVSSSFGTTSAPALGLSFGSTSTATAPTLNFATTATPASSTGLSINFSAPATTSSTLFSGLGGLRATTTTTPATTTAATGSTIVGLGGITTQQQQPTAAKTEVAPKDQTVPNEIMQTVEQFKNFIKDQKTYSSDVSRCCVKEYWKVQENLEALQKVMDDFEGELKKNRALAEKLKQDTAKGLQNADMAQRTYNTPPGMQYDNVEPIKFFVELAEEFEKKVQDLKRQIEVTNNHLKYMMKPTPLTPEDLSLGMKRLHDSFVALAGGLQTVHSQVEVQKEQYLNFRKYTLRDEKNVFAKTPTEKSAAATSIQRSINYLPPKVEFGPTPFNSITSTSFALSNLHNQPPNYPVTTPMTVPTSAPAFGAQSSLFGSSNLFGNPSSSFQYTSNNSYNFQLQKPPVGNKRGKQ